ncbi:MAG: BaiN/RdsA family NAD(P)/FAD-dependent oxidoreductase [Armatimonadota bacterium]
MDKFDIAIIGAGSAGLMAAITASKSGKNTVLIERNPRIGRKLLATGNGRCNLTNRFITVDRFHGSTPAFIETVLNQFDQPATLKFFEGLGLLMKEEDNGRIFPRTNQASSVVEVMGLGLSESGTKVILDAQVTGIDQTAFWTITLSSGTSIKADKLIIATGGRAAHQLGSTGDGLYWAQKLGHSLTPIYPALVPIETVETWPKDVQGIRVEAGVRASCEGKTLGEKTGDLLFTSYGVSGLAVLALAGSVAPMLQKSIVQLHIDLFPEMSDEQLDQTILSIFQHHSRRTIKESLAGVLPGNMIPVILKTAQLKGTMQSGELSKLNRLSVVRTIKNLTLTVSKLRPLKEAQVTAGGIDAGEINPRTLESKLHKGLYFAGEVIDVDGDSGGFNLQWAWSSGYVAGKSAASGTR